GLRAATRRLVTRVAFRSRAHWPVRARCRSETACSRPAHRRRHMAGILLERALGPPLLALPSCPTGRFYVSAVGGGELSVVRGTRRQQAPSRGPVSLMECARMNRVSGGPGLPPPAKADGRPY